MSTTMRRLLLAGAMALAPLSAKAEAPAEKIGVSYQPSLYWALPFYIASLKKWGLGPRDLRFVNLGQAQIISAVIADAGEVVGVWAPNTYTLEEKANAQVICSGADAGAVVPGALVVRAEYAKAHPAEIAKF